jgi:hypothetical protein
MPTKILIGKPEGEDLDVDGSTILPQILKKQLRRV